MYRRIIAALDGSPSSDLGLEAALAVASRSDGCRLTGCHVYASRLHRTRFEEMETGLPERYQEEQRLSALRDTHEDLISEGMQLISDAYLAPLAQKAEAAHLSFNGLTPEGHHYVKLLQAMREQQADLTVMGAYGQGYIPGDLLGSLTERILLYGDSGDILVIRQPWHFKGRPIVVGVDGSPHSYLALVRALELGKLFDAQVEAVAVYDPFFHSTVFKTIAGSLSEEAAARFNFTAQEKLHDEIIDRGLETLYQEGLTKAERIAGEMGCKLETGILAGKVWSQLHHHAALRNAGLLVVGRFGLHKEPESTIGSTALKLTRMTPGNILVVHASQDNLPVPDNPHKEETAPLPWDTEATQIIERVPSFARKMAVRTIESQAREQGMERVTAELVMQVSGRMRKKK
jgi:nucleotide-binding universal stress UspA family protein